MVARMKTCCCSCMNVERGSRVIGFLFLGVSGATVARDAFVGNSLGTLGSLVSLAFAAVLLAGIKERSPNRVLAWVLYQGVSIAFAAVVLAFFAALASDTAARKKILEASSRRADLTEEEVDAVVVGTLLALLVAVAVDAYFVAVVFSYYRQLKEDLGRGEVLMCPPGTIPLQQGCGTGPPPPPAAANVEAGYVYQPAQDYDPPPPYSTVQTQPYK